MDGNRGGAGLVHEVFSAAVLVAEWSQQPLRRRCWWWSGRSSFPSLSLMKKAGAFVASVAAASTVALPPPVGFSASVSPDAGRLVLPPCCYHQEAPVSSSSSSTRKGPGPAGSGTGVPDKAKYAPRFDGLRFIETLVTAHR